MASKTKISVVHDKEATADLKSLYQTTSDKARLELNLIQNLFNALNGGARNYSSVAVTIDDGDEVSASGTLTLNTVIANDTCAVNGVTLTCVDHRETMKVS